MTPSVVKVYMRSIHRSNQPLNNSIHDDTVMVGSVSFTCFSASSNMASPVGVSLLHTTLRSDNSRLRSVAGSKSMRPLSASSIRRQPRRPDDMQSFQKDVYP